MSIRRFNPAKPVMYQDVEYPSQGKLADHLGVCRSVISHHIRTHGNLDRMRLPAKRKCGSLISYKNGCRCDKCVRASDIEGKQKGRGANRRWCYVNGVIYESQIDAARTLGVAHSAVSRMADRRRRELDKLRDNPKPLVLAHLFHRHRAELAAEHGFDVRCFDPESPAGKLMVATCAAVIATLQQDGLDL